MTGLRRDDTDGPPAGTPSLARRLVAPAAFCVLLLAGLVVRLGFMARVSLSGDEAVFGLMSLAIARGEDYPLYCWGAHYASALVSYLGIVSMAACGITPFGFKAATLGWNIATLLLVPRMLRRDWGTTRAAAAAALLVAVPPVFLEMSVAAHGGYPETFFLGPALWFVALDLAEKNEQPAIGRSAAALLLGFLTGASFAILWLGVPFLAAAAALLVLRRALSRTEIAAAGLGALTGSLPFWIYNLWLAPASTLRRLGGRSLAAGPDTPIGDAFAARVLELPRWVAEAHDGLATLFEPLGGLGGLAVLLVAGSLGIRAMLKDLRPRRRNLAVLVIAFAVALFVFNVAGNLARPRHWTTLWLVLPFALVGLGRRAAPLVLGAVAVLTIPSTAAFIRETSPYAIIQDASERLSAAGADALVADYDLGYPVAFAIRGHIPTAAVAAPSASDRRPSWTRQVEDAQRPAALLLPGDADRLIPHLVAARWPFRRDDLGSRVLVTITGPAPAGATDTGASAVNPGAWMLEQVRVRDPYSHAHRDPRRDSAVAPSRPHP